MSERKNLKKSNMIYEPAKIQVPYEPYENRGIATLSAISFLMDQLESDKEREGVALWVINKYGKEKF